MKIYEWVTAILIFLIAGHCAYNCIGQLSPLPYCTFIVCMGLGFLVLLDGGRKKCGRSK